MNETRKLKAFKNNEISKINEVVAQYSPLLFCVVQSILKERGSSEDIEECVADVFIYLWQYPDYFDSKRGTLKNYLCLIAKSKALDQYRKLSKVQNVHIPLELIAEEEIAMSTSFFSANFSPILMNFEYEDLYKVLDMISPNDKEILLRRYVGGEKPAHIAKDLGVPTRSIVNNLYHSKNKLKLLIMSGGKL
ncbi:sigma-70 family RNA polymerase sigma factor [Cellulosilyticum sp. ST5]|uniref:sigma-70 family RNA polymerase sigma factor n=1 Tax=Cellulosilyticum sp. ST5 TaxID=3055805 RepID=UPI003977C5AF